MHKLLRNGMTVFEGSLVECSARCPSGTDDDGTGTVWAVVPIGSTFWGIVDSGASDIYLEGGEVPADS